MADPLVSLPWEIKQVVNLSLPLLDRYAPEPLPTALNQLHGLSRLSLLEILQLNFISRRLWVVILVRVGAAFIALMATSLSVLRQDELSQLAYWATAGIAVVAAVLMVVGMHLLLRIGLPRDMAASLRECLKIGKGIDLIHNMRYDNS